MAYLIFARLNDSRVIQVGSDIEVRKGDKIILDIDGILEFAEAERSTQSDSEIPAISLVRIATTADINQNARNADFQPQDKKTVLNFVTKYNLSLKLVSVLRSFDNKKLLVMYTASERVDFRQLVRDLATNFRMRIEMRQISEREEACFCGGCGACGQPICCRRFLSQPKQTTIKMAKVQGSALTPNKINGLCGKLMCCLQYEYNQYQEILATMPPIGSKVSTPSGEGLVEYNDCLRELVAIRLAGEDGVQKFSLADVKILEAKEESEDDE